MTASDDNSREDKIDGSLHSLSVQVVGSPTRSSDDDRTPKTNSYSLTEIDSPDSHDLASLVTWSTKGRITVNDASYTMQSSDHPLFTVCAKLLEPYMKKARFKHSKQEEDDFYYILAKIGESFKTKTPTERYKTMQLLNILAMFKGELTFIKIKGKGKRKTQEEVKCTLADRFRIGKNRRNPMQIQCAQIESGVMTAEEAALILYELWKTEGVLDQKVKSCKWRLKNKGFNKYQWPDSELIELLTIRAATPYVVKESTYSEDKIAEFCKRIRKKGKRKSQYIKNTAAPQLTKQWRSKGVLNEAIAECGELAKEAKLWLA